MGIRLLALDIDGTLLTSRGKLTERNQNALERTRKHGVHIVLVTGRRFGSAHMLLQELRLDLPVVSHNGALTKDTQTMETLHLHPLDVETAHEIIRAARAYGTDMICCCDEPRGPGKMVIEGISESNTRLHSYIVKYQDALVEVSDLLEFVVAPPIQLMFSGPCAQMDEFADRLETTLRGRIRLFKTKYPSVNLTVLDAVSASASKGDSLAGIAAGFSIQRHEVMAIGDNHNDLPMLHYAGLGVVMGNAEAELKQLGFVETASNEESGVAQAIEKYILQPITGK
ncbi:MAG: Cof-type HAD-IIB family hydrolase [Blastocatellia bacterium]